MADISTLSIDAVYDEPAYESEKRHSVTAPRSKSHPMAQDITADFAAAASGQCNAQQNPGQG